MVGWLVHSLSDLRERPAVQEERPFALDQDQQSAGPVARGLWSQFYIGSFYGEQLEENNYKGKLVVKQTSQ